MGVDVLYSKLMTADINQLTAASDVYNLGRAVDEPTWTTGCSASACIATSIPDRLIMDI